MPFRLRIIEDVMVGAILLMMAALASVMVYTGFYQSDFALHVADARAQYEGEASPLTTPHPLLSRSLMLLVTVLPNLSFELAAVIAMVIYTMLTTLMVYLGLRWAAPPRRIADLLLLAGLALTLQIVMPLPLPPFDQAGLNLLYIPTLAYHNPTTTPARLFALLQVALACLIFERGIRQPGRWALLAAGVTLLSLLAKPSYTLALLPVVVLLALVNRLGRHPVSWGILAALIGVALPVLAWQFFGTYTSTTSSSRVIIAPFAFYAAYDAANILLPLRWALSVAFPLAVLLMGRSKPVTLLVLGWGALLVALFQGVMLAESGTSLPYGNFLWGAIYANFVLFTLSMIVLLRRWRAQAGGLDRWLIVCLGLYALHVLSGIGWIGRVLQGYGVL